MALPTFSLIRLRRNYNTSIAVKSSVAIGPPPPPSKQVVVVLGYLEICKKYLFEDFTDSFEDEETLTL